ncbi:MAG: O-antigen ligase family protein [Candidatus Omnitrophica bacterium]|nr:O-antigen ligase family protein [Candidatus Omnitrophota bacterium]MBU1925434.1 O-antigen ligase family protein [Candidatus Omnitrophota bacterium]MBU2063360.1 O-antigen ligase family protein [Candidatus Omnitrophota bacterium]
MLNKNGHVVFGVITFLLFLVLVIISLYSKTGLFIWPYASLLAVIVFVLAFTNTDNALIVLIFSMLLSPEFELGGIHGRAVVLRLDDIFLFMVFLGWFAKTAINKELGLLRKNILNKPIIIYIFICVISSAFGIIGGTTDARYSFFYIIKYIEYFIIFFMVSNNVRDEKQVKVFLFYMLLTCLIVCVYALRFTFVEGMRASAPFEGRAGEPNTLAGYLLIMISLVIGFILYANSLRKLLLGGGFLILMMVTLLYTLSRAGWLGFAMAFITFVVFSRRAKVGLILVSIILILAAPAILPQRIISRFQSTFVGGQTYNVLGRKVILDESASLRIKSWQGSLEAWMKNPIFGWGVPGGGVVSDVQYTRILREVGIVGFIVFLWMIATLFKTAFRSFRLPNMNDFGKGLSLGFIAALVGILGMGVAAEVFIIIRIMEPFWFLAAIVSTLPEIAAPAQEPVSVQ